VGEQETQKSAWRDKMAGGSIAGELSMMKAAMTFEALPIG
jgi:hypothetical protein